MAKYVPHRALTAYQLQRYIVEARDYETPCWTWPGSRNSWGYCSVAGQCAHRAFYEHHVGEIPPGMQLDHLCRNRDCVNPAHLEPVTIQENVRRGVSPPAQNARKTHCLRGHPLSGDNLYVYKDGRRNCRICAKALQAMAYQRRKLVPA